MAPALGWISVSLDLRYEEVSTHVTDSLVNISVTDLSWFSGVWTGQVGHDSIEEHWSGPAAGTLMGMFRWIHEGQVRFYELLTIEPDGDQLLMRIKHFSPGLIGWEEKDQAVTLILVRLQPGEASFYRLGGDEPLWLFYRLEDENTLVAFFERDETGHKQEDEFRYVNQRAEF